MAVHGSAIVVSREVCVCDGNMTGASHWLGISGIEEAEDNTESRPRVAEIAMYRRREPWCIASRGLRQRCPGMCWHDVLIVSSGEKELAVVECSCAGMESSIVYDRRCWLLL
jgi:hypothetical protein